MRRRARVAEPVAFERRVVEPVQPVEPVEPIAAGPVVRLVDDALRATSGRAVVSRAEAISVLHRLESAAHDLPVGPRVVAIVDRVDRDSANQVLVPQQAVIDALLDVRSVVST